MKHLHPGRFLALLVILLATVGVAPAFGQSPNATFSGQVVDDTGGVLPGATVTLRDAAAGRERVAITDTAGRFSIAGLAPGRYALKVTLAGFETLEREAVDVDGGDQPPRLVMNVSALQDSVVVRGTARNVDNSIAGKRAADGVVDMVSTDEIGRLPDKNIGETLNRIPGVSMLLEKGEGRFVQIRGISPRLNNVTINGMAVGNAETEQGGRLMPLDVVGGDLLSGVQVLKTPTPDMDGQGIGGTLNLTTKQPFDFANRSPRCSRCAPAARPSTAFRPRTRRKCPYSMDVTLAGKTANEKLGWLAGASFSNRYTPLLGVFNDNWRTVSLGGQSITYPTNVKNNVTVTGRERLNVNVAPRSSGRPRRRSTSCARSSRTGTKCSCATVTTRGWATA